MKSLSNLLRKFTSNATADQLMVPPPVALDQQKLAGITALLNNRSQPNINALTTLVRNIDLLSLNIKTMGYDLARTLGEALPVDRATVARRVGLASKPSTQVDMESDWVAHWCGELQIPVIYHRKLWELSYILQAVFEHGHMRSGARGVGFGCGVEPMASYFAAQGATVVMTDLAQDDARSEAWAGTQQHAAAIDHAHHPALVSLEIFHERVSFRTVDMTAIPADIQDYDFCWSMCALEHLGSIANGLDFIENSLNTLRPGGMAVHTTEFNINSLGPTVDNWPTVLFQRRHFEALATRLQAAGHRVMPLDFDTGDKPLDRFIDLPPWHDGTWAAISAGLGQPLHLKIGIDGFVSTCFGMVVIKGE